MMVWKFIIVIMDLVILILVPVHAKDLASTTFLPSSHSISLPYSFKLGKVQMTLSACIEEIIERCKKMLEVSPIESVGCVTRSFKDCMHERFPQDRLKMRYYFAFISIWIISLIFETVFFNGMKFF